MHTHLTLAELRSEIARLTRALTLGATDYMWYKRAGLIAQLDSHEGRCRTPLDMCDATTRITRKVRLSSPPRAR